MRHPLVPTLLVVGLLAAYAGAGVVLADGSVAAEAVRVDGTVTGVDGAPGGDAVVLVGEYGLLSKHSPDELRSIADDDPADLAVVEVADDGSFSTTVDRRRADAVLALSDAGVSETVRLGGENATLSMQLHEHRPQTVHAAVSSVSHGETRIRMYVSLVNNGDEPVENLTVEVTSLPDGWSVADVETDGSYDEATRTLTWRSVPAGAEVDTTVTLSVPDAASVGEYGVGLAGSSGTHAISVPDGTVELLPEETAGPTTTVLGGDGATSTPRYTDDLESTATPPGTDTPRPTGTSTPGLGVLVTLAALGGLAVVAGRRADSD